MTVQTRLDRGTILRFSLKIWDQTTYKSVWSGPVSVLQSSPVSLVSRGLYKTICFIAFNFFEKYLLNLVNLNVANLVTKSKPFI